MSSTAVIEPTTWQEKFLNPKRTTNIEDIWYTATYILDYILENGPANFSLLGLQANNIEAEHLATVLRTTKIWKDIIPGWHEALAINEKALLLQNKDPKKYLHDLLN